MTLAVGWPSNVSKQPNHLIRTVMCEPSELQVRMKPTFQHEVNLGSSLTIQLALKSEASYRDYLVGMPVALVKLAAQAPTPPSPTPMPSVVPSPTATPPGGEDIPPSLREAYSYLHHMWSSGKRWILLGFLSLLILGFLIRQFGQGLVSQLGKNISEYLVKWLQGRRAFLARSRLMGKYLDLVEGKYGQIEVVGLIPSIGGPVKLDEVYVSPRGTVISPVLEGVLASLDVESYLEEGDLRAATTVLLDDLATKYSRLLVVGDVGSGKTTFLNHTMQAEALKCKSRRIFIKRRMSPQVPFYVSASGFSTLLAGMKRSDGPEAIGLLGRYLSEQYKDEGLTEVFFQAVLASGHCIVLFDALDDLPLVDEQYRMVRYISLLAQHLPSSRLIVTSKEVTYGSHLMLAGFAVAQLQELPWKDVVRLTRSWNRVLTKAILMPKSAGSRVMADESAQGRALQLLRQIEQDPALRRLAGSPLLLSMMILLYVTYEKVPAHRAAVYDKCVQMLLIWDSLRSPLEQSANQAIELPRHWSPDTARLLLEDLAFEMQTERCEMLARRTAQDYVAERIVKQLEPRRQLAEGLARRFLQWALDRSHVLRLEGDSLRFTHLQFQRFLAARYMVRQATFMDLVAGRLEDPWWRETLELTFGLLGPFSPERLAQTIAFMIEYDEQASDKRYPYVGLQIISRGLESLSPELLEVSVRRRVAERAQAVISLSDMKINTGERVHLARCLSLAGEVQDLRDLFLVSACRVRIGLTAADLAQWTDTVWQSLGIATCDQDDERVHKMGVAFQEWLNAEIGDVEIDVPEFRIGKYPITNSFYAEFMQDGGYVNREVWTNEGWTWCAGELERLKMGGIQVGALMPRFWADPRFSHPSAPVVGVSWYEASAFCSWLTIRWQESGRISQDEIVHLPTEAQWEKAAGYDPGTERKRVWPWGDTWISGRANTSEERIGNTTPVGTFPENSSAYGVIDLAGNVWEWCNTRWGGDRWNTEFRYPYRCDDGREEKSGDHARTIRGGSWDQAAIFARCTARRGRQAKYSGSTLGFRIAVSKKIDIPWHI